MQVADRSGQHQDVARRKFALEHQFSHAQKANHGQLRPTGQSGPQEASMPPNQCGLLVFGWSAALIVCLGRRGLGLVRASIFFFVTGRFFL
jgi:hypothetical protein